MILEFEILTELDITPYQALYGTKKNEVTEKNRNREPQNMFDHLE